MPYDPNLTRMAEQDLKDAYWDATERQLAQLRELYESEYGDPGCIEYFREGL